MKSKLIPTITLLLLLAGCTTQPARPYHEGGTEAYGPPQIHIIGPDAENLRLSTIIELPITSCDSAKLLAVTIPVRNTTDRVLHLQYRYNFIDKDGAPLPEKMDWNRKTLEPGATERITFNSTSPQAADFQMDLRYGR